jgi:hypothetical protein
MKKKKKAQAWRFAWRSHLLFNDDACSSFLILFSFFTGTACACDVTS